MCSCYLSRSKCLYKQCYAEFDSILLLVLTLAIVREVAQTHSILTAVTQGHVNLIWHNLHERQTIHYAVYTLEWCSERGLMSTSEHTDMDISLKPATHYSQLFKNNDETTFLLEKFEFCET